MCVSVLGHLVGLEGLKEDATMEDVAKAMGAGPTDAGLKGMSQLTEDYLNRLHEFEQTRLKMSNMGQELEETWAETIQVQRI